MPPRHPPRPTDAELEILRVLWEAGPCTVRQVHDQIGEGRRAGYTTILKQLQIMFDKGLVARDESARSHVYRARYESEQTQGQLVRDLLMRAFGGQTAKLVLQALSAKPASPTEIAEIKRLLEGKMGVKAEDRGSKREDRR
ncbi:MAG: BlaI/MecI/CopY family transcriptional regulator [Planctomycetaceae bacterium]